ncbi:MAG: hypothetical protein BalsKO_16800 [Balneolaceae bacterium]
MRQTIFKALMIVLVLFLFEQPSVKAFQSYESNANIYSAFIIDQNTIRIEAKSEIDKTNISIKLDGKSLEIIRIKEEKTNLLHLTTNEKLIFSKSYFVELNGEKRKAQPHWKAIDELYTYGGDLGLIFNEEDIEFKLWAPLASEVTLNLYKKGLDESPYEKVSLSRKEKGIWSTSLLKSVYGEFYTYSVTNFEETKEVLDPYAKSMAVTVRDNFFNPRGAIVDPSMIGTGLEFAKIKGFEKKEDAIIWEAHVWDMTSDPEVTTEAQFGSYKAFIERIDYVGDLGITHIQLLPVLSYTYSDELIKGEREVGYKLGANYNWGYGPDNYFSPEGMYSENPEDPVLRIYELKELINSIHEQEMGVILDVVYNHTAQLSFLEDIVPGYYHFMDSQGNPKLSYGGGRPGSTHAMVRKLIVDSIVFWTKEYKVDGFRYDLMGDLDGKTIQIAYDEAKKINPNILKVGECWRTFAGDDGESVTPADQDWMNQTNSVACFSDEIRDELKSGHGIEGEPRFITGGARSIETIFNNVIAKPANMTEDDPGDILQYIAVHDGLTLHDMIALSIQKDPSKHQGEIQKRIRLGNAMILTSQGLAFLHAGQEYGRTKQWKSDVAPEREYIMVEGFEYPYLIRNSYDASDAVNMFDWDKVEKTGIHKETMEFTKGLIELRKSSDAFRLGKEELIQKNVLLIESDEVQEEDVVLFFKTESTSGEQFYILINADAKQRKVSIDRDLRKGTVLVDSDEAGSSEVSHVSGVQINEDNIIVEPLTVVVIKTN